jgi:tetratricopeptide (TPR) repeat protein
MAEESMQLLIKKESTVSESKLFMSLNTYGIAMFKQGNRAMANDYLNQAISIGRRLNAHLDVTTWFLGILCEIENHTEKAELFFIEMMDENRKIDHNYFECAALTSLIRVKHTQGDIAAIPSLLAEAEQLALQYEYNDHLASLRLTQGYLAWENGNQDEALAFYQQAMIYALRYNRFLLDELISGRSQGTPLRPIIPYCLERGEEGKKILSALRDWWKTGVNDIGTPRPDTISRIPEGMPLLEAEKIAREREPGDGVAQKSVIEQIQAVL